ncbi:hypothetical protein D3C72_626920 [compost metagenome]
MARNQVTLTAVGAGQVTVPTGVTVAFIESWGAGGRLGGAYAYRLMVVTPGEQIPYVNGAPGQTIAYNYNPTAGGNSTFASGERLVSAQGGPASATAAAAAVLAGDGGHVGGRTPSGRGGGGAAGPRGIGYANSGDSGGAANGGLVPAGTTTGLSTEDGGSGGTYRSSTNYGGGAPGGGYARGDEYSTASGGRGQTRITWFEGEHVIRPIQTSLNVATSGAYASAVAGVGVYTSAFGWVGQYKSSASSYDIDQVMLSFDLSSYSGRTITTAYLNISVGESYGFTDVEVRIHDWANNTSAFIPAANIAAKPLLGTTRIQGTGFYSIPLTGVPSGQSTLKVALVSSGQRTMTPPAADDTSLLLNAQATLTVELGAPIVVSVPATANVLSSSMSITGQQVFTAAGATALPPAGSMQITGHVPSPQAGALARPLSGSLTISGAQVVGQAGATARASAGILAITGNPVSASASARAEPLPGSLSISPQNVSASAGATAYPAASLITITGGQVTVSAGTSIAARADVPAGSMQIAGQQVSASAGATASVLPASLTVTGQLVIATAGHAPIGIIGPQSSDQTVTFSAATNRLVCNAAPARVRMSAAPARISMSM